MTGKPAPRGRTRFKVCCISSIDEAELAITFGADAVRRVRPFGVDVCSGLRTDDVLDTLKLAGFFRELEVVVRTPDH
ncbi:MAG: hypothetical protein E4H44_01925 [Candidatus Aminicenantes bacterium]|nr:MAG: hypothetical protein E4H44_01925 [Candidatus Aminicenantes bacterium]